MAADAGRPANGAGSGKQPAGAGGSAQNVGVEQFNELARQVAALAKSMNDQGVNMNASLRELQQGNSTLAQALQQIASGQAAKQPEPKEEALDPDKVERMSNMELLKTLEGRNAAMLKKLLTDEIVPHIKTLREGLGTVDASVAVNAMRGKYKDFDAWMPDVEKIVKDSKGTLDLDDAYQLARAKNPTKAKEQDEKLKASEGADSAKAFGGLKPTSTPQKVEKQDMNEVDAAETAWNEVMASLPEDTRKELVVTSSGG